MVWRCSFCKGEIIWLFAKRFCEVMRQMLAEEIFGEIIWLFAKRFCVLPIARRDKSQ